MRGQMRCLTTDSTHTPFIKLNKQANINASTFVNFLKCFIYLVFRYQLLNMASGTRGQQDLNNLKELVGPSKPFPQADLPSLREILAAGMHIKEVSLTAHLSIQQG